MERFPTTKQGVVHEATKSIEKKKTDNLTATISRPDLIDFCLWKYDTYD